MKPLLLSLILSTTLLIACSDDDDFKGSTSSDTVIIETDNGDKVMISNGVWSYRYDQSGKCVGVSRFDLSNANKITIGDNEMLQLSYNGSGYISKVGFERKSSYSNDKYTINATYNDNEQLFQLTYENTYTSDYQYGPYKKNGTIDFYYEDGNLDYIMSKIDWSELFSSNGFEYTDGGYNEYFIAFEYSEDVNVYAQMPRYQMYYLEDIDYIFSDYLAPFFAIGYFGRGSENLLTKTMLHARSYYYDNDKDDYYQNEDESYYSSTPVSISLNTDATIYTENSNYYRYESVGE